MNAKIFWLSIIAVIISFVGGFYLANALNRNELTALRGENERLKKNGPENQQDQSDTTLADDEIRQKIAEADKNPSNIAFQRDLGLALFSYGAMKQDVKLIAESARLIQRVFDNNPKDYDVIVTLGNAYYDIASINNDGKSFIKSREFYLKALDEKPADAGVRADYGSTFLFADPNDFDKANAELQRALQIDPKNERALKFMTQVLLKQNKKAEAEKYQIRLKAINPKTPDLEELNSQLSENANTVKK